MATLKSIRKRIQSVKNTQKITKAMKMVAAAKLRRAQQALVQARPYALFLKDTLARSLPENYQHPLLDIAEAPKHSIVLVLTSDRGLCGGFNGNLLRKVEHFIHHEGQGYESLGRATIGRKGRDYYRAKNIEVLENTSLSAKDFGFAEAQGIAQKWIAKFQAGEVDTFYLAFNQFVSAISQNPLVEQVLPLRLERNTDMAVTASVVWEGDKQEILDGLVQRYAELKFFIALLESQASELGSRMSAMDNATSNASDMISNLTLIYNRARQAAITTELMDIVNGAEALH